MPNSTINKTFLILLLGILAAIGPLTIDMYIPGFANIAKDFQTDENRVALTMTSYFIGIALGQLFYGPLVDKYGRKKPLLYGLIIYTLSAVVISLSQSIEMMTLIRFFQALGGSAGMVASTAIITDVYKPDERARAFSLIMLVMGLAPILAPSFGSLILTYYDWEAIFYFLAIFATAVILMIFVFLPETSQHMHNDKLKVKRVAGDYLEVLKNKHFALYTIGGGIANSMIFAYIASSAYIFLTYYNLSKAEFSIIFGMNAFGFISGSYLNGLLSKRVNYLKILNRSSSILMIAAVAIAIIVFFNSSLPYQFTVASIFIIQFLIGFTYPNATAASLAPFTKRSGSASAMNGAMRMAMGASVTAVIGFIATESTFVLFATQAVLAVLSWIAIRFARKHTNLG